MATIVDMISELDFARVDYKKMDEDPVYLGEVIKAMVDADIWQIHESDKTFNRVVLTQIAMKLAADKLNYYYNSMIEMRHRETAWQNNHAKNSTT